MLDTSGGRSCDFCQQMIHTDTFVSVSGTLPGYRQGKTFSLHLHPDCAAVCTVTCRTATGLPVEALAELGPREVV